MNKVIFVLVLVFSFSVLMAQPCKMVKPGMSKTEVLRLVGNPLEIDTLGYDTKPDGTKDLNTVWQYGDVTKEKNQRITFLGEVVYGEVIADGKKYDELIQSLARKEITKKAAEKMINELNNSACK